MNRDQEKIPSICEKHSNPLDVITSQDEIIKSTQQFAQSQVDVLAAVMTSQRFFLSFQETVSEHKEMIIAFYTGRVKL